MTQTTTPDNIPSPDLTDQYALTQDMANLADGTQLALNRRANLYIGTANQRAAFTTAPAGVHWKDTDGSRMLWARESGTWVPASPRIVTGSVTLTAPNSSTTVSSTITFPAGTFRVPPSIQLTGGTGAASTTNMNYWVSGSPTVTGATISLSKSTTNPQVIHWAAIG